MIVVNAIKATGVKHANQIFKQTVMSGLIAAIALVFIYVSLGFIGNHMNVDSATLKNLTAKDRKCWCLFINNNGDEWFWCLR